MATKEQIKDVILKVAGEPVSGPIADLADQWAEAIVALDNPQAAASAPAATKETRITKPVEVR
jgi:hypothetical protein